jgi:hypothetical protein
MGWQGAIRSKITGCVDNAGSKDKLPKTIDSYPRGQGIFFAGDPFC